eukprot:354866-Chlamydomonas_euryale.AAC.6
MCLRNLPLAGVHTDAYGGRLRCRACGECREGRAQALAAPPLARPTTRCSCQAGVLGTPAPAFGLVL